MALIKPLEGGRPAPFDEQSIVNEQLFAWLNVTQRVDIDATALLLRLAVGRATVVYPAGRVSALPAIDHRPSSRSKKNVWPASAAERSYWRCAFFQLRTLPLYSNSMSPALMRVSANTPRP